MTSADCLREQDVLDAVASGRWPQRLDEELRAHVSGCAICADLAEVAAAFATECEMPCAGGADLPPAEVVWYRAQSRARAESTRLAGTPIVVAQYVAVACAVGALAALTGATLQWLPSGAAWLSAGASHLVPAAGMFDPSRLGASSLALRGLLLMVTIWLVLAPVAVYLAAGDD